MKKILILNGQYLPGYRGGGPIRSIQNLVDNLQDEFEFYILTSDRDFKMKESYENIKFNLWIKKGNYNVFYMTPDKQNLIGFRNIINSIDYDILYLNGYFSPIYTIKPLILKKLGLLKRKPIILSARGDFSKGHLNIKKFKKNAYIVLSKIIGLYNEVYWHATSDLEVNDIKNIFKKSKVLKAPNLSAKVQNNQNIRIDKKALVTKLVFLSRICEKKNLLFALEILKDLDINGEIVFDIYGPREDLNYWGKCEEIIKELPSNIKVSYKGEVLPININNVLSQYHAFLFPTYGENYGHAIVEAFYAGCIPIISDQTPWKNLEKNNVGYDIELDNKDKYKKILTEIHYMDNKRYKIIRENSINYYNNFIFNKKNINENKKVFNMVV